MSILPLLVLFAVAPSCFANLHYGVKDVKTKTYCLILNATDFGGTVVYYNEYTKSDTKYSFKVDEKTLNYSGSSCNAKNGTEQTLKISFLPLGEPMPPPSPSKDATAVGEPMPPPSPKDKWALNLTFAKDGNQNGSFKLVDYTLKAIFYPPFNYSQADAGVDYDKAQGAELEWGAYETHGFQCSKTGLNLVNSSSVEFTDLKLIAFASLPTDEFPQPNFFEKCKADLHTNDLIPIIVGACLAGLVIVVLVAYLVGRARAKRQGYASV